MNIRCISFKNFLFLLITLVLIESCQTTGYFISDSNLPIPETRKAITAVIGKPYSVSLNGRELISEFHDEKFKLIEEGQFPKQRFFTKTLILGARRPYEINVQVIRQQFENETKVYINTGLDDGLSKKRAIEIKKAHNYSLEKQQRFDGDIPF